jgi:hypothetical protein
MASAACVAAPVTHLVSVEVIEGLVSAVRMWTSVAVMWIEAVINVAVEVVGAVEPRAGADEHATAEPLGPVVPVWGTVVWGVVVVAVRASWFCTDIDGDLSRRRAWDAQQSGNQGRKGKQFPKAHEFLLTPEGGNPDAKVVMNWKRLKLRKGWVNAEHAPKLHPVCK